MSRMRIDYPRSQRRGWRRWIPSWKLTGGLLLVFTCALAALVVAVYQRIQIPDAQDLARRQATVYYWADGSRMVSVGDVNRQDVALAQIPESVQRAVIAAENADFYSDVGVSVTGVLRAAVNIAKGKEVQGGSTITQQYVKNTYLSQDQTAQRKVKELFLAVKVSNRRSKAEILEGYLNTSWFGRGAYGIEAASQAYYGVPAARLDPSQAALLAAVLKGAEGFDPSLGPANHERAVGRWKWVLDRQVETGTMSSEERAKYTKFPEPKPPVKPTSQAGQTGYLVDLANKYLKSRVGITDKDLALGGYSVHTTFRKDRTAALAKAVEQVRRERLDPDRRAQDRYVEVGATSVSTKDGAVVAVYGGSDAVKHFSNNADTSGVPAASAFKPFVYAAALEQEPPSRESPLAEDSPDGRAPDGTASSVPQPLPAPPSALANLHESLVTSDNTPFVTVGKRIGLPRVKKLAVAAGMREQSMAKLEPTFAIGTSTPSAVRLASAYTTFANRGLAHEPYSVTKVVRDGVPVSGLGRPAPLRAMRSETADVVGAALQQVSRLAQGLSRSPGSYRLSWAGRTGPNDRMKSAWYIGMTQELSTSIGMFRTKPDVTHLLPMTDVGGPDTERGGTLPPLVWRAYEASP
ncbi:transglycosylase domain-containing protein [Streptomyces sp. NPDC004250]|uniref:transglycosylase domain-containing protein n=1 Tax=Streptomyces sp. NPDC004250 TaxID=3364692 RepID=UPI0036ABDD8A